MTEVTRCVFLQAIKQGESSLVIKLYSEPHGVSSYLFKGARTKRASLPLIPMAVYELVAPPFDGKLKVIKSITLDAEFPIPMHDPTRAAQAMFIAETISKCLTEEPPSFNFFNYLTRLSMLVGNNASSPDLHVSFLVQTAALCGILPEAEPSRFFDLREGQFSSAMPMHGDVIDAEETDIFRQCLSLGAFGEKSHLRNRSTRSLAARLWLRYLKTHLPGMGQVESMDVLEEIFAD